jgi:hypothetical protein
MALAPSAAVRTWPPLADPVFNVSLGWPRPTARSPMWTFGPTYESQHVLVLGSGVGMAHGVLGSHGAMRPEDFVADNFFSRKLDV